MTLSSVFRSRAAVVAAGALVVGLAASGGGAVAASLVTSHDIKDGTIQSVDLHPGLGATLTHTKQVKRLNGKFRATNPTVSMTPDGVEFGPYADGGATGGSIKFSGLNGMKLSDVKNLVYYMRYTASNDSGGVGVPYLRIFLRNDKHDAVFSPNTQSPDPDIAEGPFHEWVATSGSWRYDDDQGTGPDQSFSDLVAAHGTDTISGIYISTGFSNGQNLSSLLRWMQVNGVTYHFGS